MARLLRREAPESVIILGGHGAAIEGVEELIDCDHVVKGEGIRWLREFLGENPGGPIVHPILPASERESIFGVPIPKPTASILVPGVGCVNGCHFCCTTHFFGKTYTPFLGSGRALFDQCCRIADARRTPMFFVLDENFLKERDRARELLSLMERRQRWFTFHIFSSAEAVIGFGLDNLVRLGVAIIWVGIESRNTEAFAKNAGIDPHALVRELRRRGIMVLASGILGMEHHTPGNIMQDIDFLVSLKADMVQFMLLTGLPITWLYESLRDRSLLRHDLPFEEWHGQDELNYRHPAFADGEMRPWLDLAFRRDFEVNGSSISRMVETSLMGHQTLAALPDRDACLEARLRQMKARLREYAALLPVIARHAVSREERAKARAVDAEQRRLLGPPTARERCVRAAARIPAAWWALRVKLVGDGLQPATIMTRYRGGRRVE
jgi:hypothetical protein